MTERATRAQVHLQEALNKVNELCAPIEGMTLQDWYVIATHRDKDGEEVHSRFTRFGQAPWTDAGLLSYSLESDKGDWQGDDEA